MTKPAPAHDTRNLQLAKIHILKKDNNMDDETYRDFLEKITGKRSAGKMNYKQLADVLSAFRNLRTPHARRDTLHFDGNGRQNLIKALFSDAVRFGHFESRNDSALNHFVKRQTGIEAVNWLRENGDYDKVIQALKSMVRRKPIKIPTNAMLIMTPWGCKTAIKYVTAAQTKEAYKERLLMVDKNRAKL